MGDKPEFTIKTEKANSPSLDGFNIWVEMDKDNTIVFSTDLKDGKAINDNIVIIVEGKENSFELGLSVK